MILFTTLLVLLLSFKFIVLTGFLFNFKKLKPVAGEDLPTVSVLVPARNESKILANCINALGKRKKQGMAYVPYRQAHLCHLQN